MADGAGARISPAAGQVVAAAGLGADPDLRAVIGRRADELIAYADRGYAEEFAARVRQIADTERASLGGPGALTESYARNLFSLMAYKEEYEVARLSLDPALHDTIAAQFGAQATVSYHLHPPILRAMGMKKKITLGPWFRPAFRILYAGRRVRQRADRRLSGTAGRAAARWCGGRAWWGGPRRGRGRPPARPSRAAAGAGCGRCSTRRRRGH